MVEAHRWRQAWTAIGWIAAFAVVYASLIPDAPRLDVPQGDKLEHVAAYGCLMLWFAQLSTDGTFRARTALALVLLGIVVEFAQLFTTYRTFSVGDMLANGTGVAIGWLAAPPRSPNLLHLLNGASARINIAPTQRP